MGKGLTFDSRRKEIPVTITLNDGDKKFILREFVGIDRKEWFEFLGGSASLSKNEDGEFEVMIEKVEALAGMQSRLISLCLFDEKDGPVTEEFIQTKLTSTVIDKLFKAAQELNGLNKEAEEEAKKD